MWSILETIKIPVWFTFRHANELTWHSFILVIKSRMECKLVSVLVNGKFDFYKRPLTSEAQTKDGWGMCNRFNTMKQPTLTKGTFFSYLNAISRPIANNMCRIRGILFHPSSPNCESGGIEQPYYARVSAVFRGNTGQNHSFFPSGIRISIEVPIVDDGWYFRRLQSFGRHYGVW